ncbi:hypothetical protein JGU71_24520 [Antrihabitans sp. YC3-6]|uniref:Uncharacterized protein n=1 Tax=Antrihabitans stalagmiti TaxID=2799499 RepID=A0A934NUY7_9NOCA|nr:hypothetical protein [Antrihabitans stalagmiti]MBJ8342058.1 hypothetical protein [Antrihabitans stalagmiti]
MDAFDNNAPARQMRQLSLPLASRCRGGKVRQCADLVKLIRTEVVTHGAREIPVVVLERTDTTTQD